MVRLPTKEKEAKRGKSERKTLGCCKPGSKWAKPFSFLCSWSPTCPNNNDKERDPKPKPKPAHLPGVLEALPAAGAHRLGGLALDRSPPHPEGKLGSS